MSGACILLYSIVSLFGRASSLTMVHGQWWCNQTPFCVQSQGFKFKKRQIKVQRQSPPKATLVAVMSQRPSAAGFFYIMSLADKIDQEISKKEKY
jgi:hypothetical protein